MDSGKTFLLNQQFFLYLRSELLNFSSMLNQYQIKAIQKILNQADFVKKAWLFGSYSRNEETSQSDVDIMFEKTENARFGLIQFTSTILQLENALGKKIDFIPISTMLECVKKDANINKILLYERS